WLEDDHIGPLHVQTDAGVEVRACPLADWVEHLPISRDDVGLVIRMYCPEDRAFVDAVTEGRPPYPGLDDAVVAHRLVDAAYRSAAAGGVPLAPG
ncbi:MAG: hypothetical protein ABSG81_09350, partial [Acidimicrobiales bacterium]